MNKPHEPASPATPQNADLKRNKGREDEDPRRGEFFMDMPRKGATERRREGKR